MTGQVRWSLAITAVGILGLLVFTLWYTGKTARDSERKWCGIVSTLDDSYQSGRPTTAIGQRLAEQMNQLRNDFGC